MAIHYPNGTAYHGNSMPVRPSSQGKRGMRLEDDLNAANQYYRDRKIAVIYKKPTPIQIVDVDYPSRSAAQITKAFFRQASTTDYNGIYRGKYIDFDAKETANLNSFPLKNVHAHQVKHLQAIQEQGGLALMIIRFTKRNETYVIWANLLFEYWQQQDAQRKSIPYDTICQRGVLVPESIQPSTPYLTAVDLLIDRQNKGV